MNQEKFVFPVSFSQQRLWFLNQLEPESVAYNVASAFRLTGRLNLVAFQQALNEIVRRHESLRTTFPSVDGKPVQEISAHQQLAVNVVDLRSMSQAEREPRARTLTQEEAQRPFDLTRGPLFRTTLLRMADEDHILLLTKQHIISDGWSMGVLCRELSALYNAYNAQEPSPLPPLPIQYADYAVWQQEWLRGEVLERQLAYWKAQLAGAAELLELPTDYARPSHQSYRGQVEEIAISKSLLAGLQQLSQQAGVTLFMTLLTAFQILLFRYSGQDDIIVGSPIANRTRAEVEGLIGFFVNTLALRTNLSGNPTFRELLGRVRRVCLEAYAHQDLPFEKLAEEIQPVRTLSYHPLFQVMFILQNTPPASLELSGLSASRFIIDNETSAFDMMLSLTQQPEGLRGWLKYSTDLFTTPTAQRFLAHLQTLLSAAVTRPDAHISDFPLMAEEEQRQVLVDWNETHSTFGMNSCIHELFEDQVQRTPNAVALVYKGQQLTYEELNLRANRLAHYLRSLGIGQGDLVGLCLERSADMVVGLLAILKAGGAYLPLDPTYPTERLAFMLCDSGTGVVLTRRELAGMLPDADVRVVCLDADASAISKFGGEKPPHATGTNSPLYVMYTSGSTGRPKAVVGLHQGAVNRIAWLSAAYPFAEDEVCCQKTALSFVDSVAELFGPLLHGVSIVIIPDEAAKDPVHLVRMLAAHKITRIGLVPSLLQAILDSHRDLKERLPKLKIWASGGEALSVRLWQRFRETMPHSTLLNLYGSTEVSACVTWHDTSLGTKVTGTIPIGRPIANAQTYILDSYLRPVPIGVPGELCAGGIGLASGYLNRPELTAERFIPSPFGPDRGSRLYRTGDLARYLPDGSIEFLGRIDQQIKVRGYRIEPGEIESTLNQHPEVRNSVVVARYDGIAIPSSLPSAGTGLVAYFVSNSAPEPRGSELRRFLQHRLPDYMIPSGFVSLEALPLLPNGKIDRRALPSAEPSSHVLEQVYVAPRTAVEELLADIFVEILSIEKVGVYDNFFELGGHSLLATQVVSRIRDTLRVDVPLLTMFEVPTVAELSEAIAARTGKPAQLEKIAQLRQRLKRIPAEQIRRTLEEHRQQGGHV
jgi:amino acid adenylation domain-containing protein